MGPSGDREREERTWARVFIGISLGKSRGGQGSTVLTKDWLVGIISSNSVS